MKNKSIILIAIALTWALSFLVFSIVLMINQVNYTPSLAVFIAVITLVYSVYFISKQYNS